MGRMPMETIEAGRLVREHMEVKEAVLRLNPERN
jgi:hypothetical protein